jgi:hypothetical protein
MVNAEMAELRHWHDVCLTKAMLKRLARLFTIKTRFEAFLVTYAIAVGAVERGQHYLQQYPGTLGLFMALCCTGVVFLAGGKLLDAVRPQAAPALARLPAPPRARRNLSRSRPRFRRTPAAARSRGSFRKG